ncbi:MAG: aldo/keto reductase [Aestuariivita sp.]|nr:aldo/keto reductase [Aestuariivita sp.]MCY4201286.1 aldo/keto reductase [Aestuariivita sp.]MCY4289493.1 aldo/keto reductase [Aestuariivita sp.]MCY4347303.1 aldo/keto reductase [Aestuariivita sp.]
MKRNVLGNTDLRVPELCLGSMTWGYRNSADEAFAQIEFALDRGINFIDTAEMYPFCPNIGEFLGRTEQIIGDWNAKSKRRSEYILATKHSGAGLRAARDGAPITAESIPLAIEGSLRRLKTDYIDLYQFHWPNRGSYMFRQNWAYDPSHQVKSETLDNMRECLQALETEVQRGTIRHFGLSNESCWGTSQWLQISEAGVGPQVVSIQNEYSLLCRLYDTDLAELSVNENVGLLAFSPLATGLLTGKYQDGAVPKGSRMEMGANLGGRATPQSFAAVQAYLEIAGRHQIDPVHLSLAFCRTRPFMASAIFGATSLTQLETVINSADVELSDEVLEEINQVHQAHPMPF